MAPGSFLAASLLVQLVQNPPAMQETWVRSLGQIPGSGDPLEKEMTTHSSILAWEIPWAEEPGWLQTVQKVKHVFVTKQQ